MSTSNSPAATLSAHPKAGRVLGLYGRTLEKHRCYGTGPKYRKIGGRVTLPLGPERSRLRVHR